MEIKIYFQQGGISVDISDLQIGFFVRTTRFCSARSEPDGMQGTIQELTPMCSKVVWWQVQAKSVQLLWG